MAHTAPCKMGGELLRDANELYRLGRWARTVMLAVFCLEEISKAMILMREAEDAEDKCRSKSIENIKQSCRPGRGRKSHEEKLKSARHVIMTASVHWWGDTPPADLDQQLDKKLRAARESAGKEAQDARERATYVDWNTEEGDWERPADITQDEANDMLLEAGARYCVCRNEIADRIKPGWTSAALARYGNLRESR